jgi:hypothetical protein
MLFVETSFKKVLESFLLFGTPIANGPQNQLKKPFSPLPNKQVYIQVDNQQLSIAHSNNYTTLT